MWHYFLNWMGPINREFIEKNGSNWCGGRIDVDCCDHDTNRSYEMMYGEEYSMEIIDSKDWDDFAELLLNIETGRKFTKKELEEEFEKVYNRKLTRLNRRE